MRNYKTSAYRKRHYEEIAAILRNMKPESHESGRPFDEAESGALAMWKEITARFVVLFAADNRNFDKSRFLNAAGWSEIT